MVQSMRWNDQYKIDVDFIDDQHQEWFAKVANFGAAINQQHMIAEVARTLKFVVDYSQKHLSDEERYMREINYPHIDNQIKLHKEFMQRIVSVLTDLKNGKKVIPSQLHDFMSTWIRQHILEHDRQIGEFIAARQNNNVTNDQPPPEPPSDPLMKKLKELSALLESKLITQEDYEDTTKDLLLQFTSDTYSEGDASVLEKFDKLTALQNQGLVSDEGIKAATAKMAQNIDIDQALEPYDTPKTKMHALNALLKNKLITTEQHEAHKSVVLSGI